jgi:fused signal recognition particle receptor
MKFSNQGKKVMLAACDTFRAAAVEQLVAWSERANCQIMTGQENQDPSSVAFQAVTAANQNNVDVLIIDTAGRLNNNKNLMLELEKLIRVIQKINPNTPQDTIMVLDGCTGQNAMQQLDAFKKHVNIKGLIVTKLDGTAKGGILLSLTNKHQLPIYAIGVGESIEDLHTFNPKEFAKALLG